MVVVVSGGVVSEAYWLVADGCARGDQIFLDGGAVDGERLDGGTGLSAQISLCRIPRAHPARLVVAEDQTFSRSVRRRGKLFGKLLHSPVHIRVNAHRAAQFVGRKEGKALQFVADRVYIVVRGNAGFSLLRKGLSFGAFVLFLCDLIEGKHRLQNVVPNAQARRFIDKRRVIVGGTNDSGEHCTLGERQIFYFFFKVKVCGFRDAVTGMSEVNGVEIHFQNFIFGVFFFQLASEADLFHLAPQCFFSGKLRVLDELLADGGGALLKGVRFQIF